MTIVFLVMHIIGKQFRNRKRRVEITSPGTIRVILKIINYGAMQVSKRGKILDDRLRTVI